MTSILSWIALISGLLIILYGAAAMVIIAFRKIIMKYNEYKGFSEDNFDEEYEDSVDEGEEDDYDM